MKLIRGFRGEGDVVGGGREGASVLVAAGGDHVTSSSESHDSHVEADESQEEEAGDRDLGREIQLALRLPGRIVKEHFHTKDKVRVCVCMCVCVCGIVHTTSKK